MDILNNGEGGGKIRKTRRGKHALREIRIFQGRCDNLIPFQSIKRIIRRILLNEGNFRLSKDACQLLIESSEDYIIRQFKMAQLLAEHRQRETIEVGDMTTSSLIVRVNNGEEVYKDQRESIKNGKCIKIRKTTKKQKKQKKHI